MKECIPFRPEPVLIDAIVGIIVYLEVKPVSA
jgi:hypothetical protein